MQAVGRKIVCSETGRVLLECNSYFQARSILDRARELAMEWSMDRMSSGMPPDMGSDLRAAVLFVGRKSGEVI